MLFTPNRPSFAAVSPATAQRRLLPWTLPLACAALALVGGCATPVGPTGPATPPSSPPAVPAPATTAPSTAAPAPETAAQVAEENSFKAWLDSFGREALVAGIRPATVQQVLLSARLLPRVIELDRAQPEFTRTPWAYLDSAVSPQRVTAGRAKRMEYRMPLGAAEARYGVPASIITAIWGMESNYGGNFGSFRAVDALATLAFEGRRRDWARSELLAALRIVDQGDIPADRMVGSWAGAMGNTQFLPSVFLAHAVDADGDGRRDIWGSIPDVTASTANYLASAGWRRGEPWGVEVRLPTGFDHSRAELNVRQTSTQWAADGVQAMDGQPLPAFDAASVIEPAGARGPAFLVGPNFRAILRYNNSINYALGVGLLARQIEGAPGLMASWPRDLQPLSRSQVLQLQTGLNQRGFAAGTADGVFGPATRAGLRQFQRSLGLEADGYPTTELLQRLMNPA